MVAPDTELIRKRAIVAFVDVVESVRLIAEAEALAVQRIRDFLRRARELVAEYGGQVMERRGDGMVLIFDRTIQAVQCAALLHEMAAAEMAQHPGTEPLRLRAGMHKTEMLADAEALYGIGVNLAARIAAQGQPGETLLSSTARDELLDSVDGVLEDMGPCWLKHVDEPIRLFKHRVGAQPLPGDLESAIVSRMKLRPTLAVLALQGKEDGVGQGRNIDLGAIATDQLIRRISQSPMLHVISALSAMALRGRPLELEQIYSMLRADYVLHGNFSGSGAPADQAQRIELHMELWRKGSPEPVWQTALSGRAIELLSTESDLLGRIVHEVSHRILAVEQRVARAAQALPTLASHTLHLAAVDLLHRFAATDFLRARELLMALRVANKTTQASVHR
jgi:class 3 adenylate cyclase/TolB-like protein